jgi:hypothetical protein
LGFGHTHRPECRLITRPEPARDAVHRPRIQERSARDLQSGSELGLLRVYVKFHHRHRRDGPDVVRVDDREQRFGDLRKLVIDLQVNARREKRERLHHPLYVRVFAGVRIQL